jgi:hypothetical protein
VRRAILIAVALNTFACSDDPLVRLQPKIVVEPNAVDFGDGIVNRDNFVELTITNGGEGVLEIDRVTFTPDSGVFGAQDVPEVVQPIVDEQTMLAVFHPRAPHEIYEGTMTIHSNDPVTPALEVPLDGVGGVREIEVLPMRVDFGVVNEGTAPVRAIEIKNVGKDILTITRVTFTSTSTDLALVAGTFTGGTIEALTSTIVEVRYSPVDLGSDSALVTISSDDEDEPTTEVEVVGTANLAPRAIAWACERTPGTPGCENAPTFRDASAGVRRALNFDGRESTDPEGGRIDSYRWELIEKPDGAAGLFQSSEDRQDRRGATGDLQVDRVGRYEYRLIVRDERGLDSLDRPESHIVVRPKDLEVRLVWDVGTDVDLHLVRPGGSVGDYGSGQVGTSTGSDCSSFNRSPNWNDPMSPFDDPSLDRDVVSGEGPEIISLDAPEAGGAYEVYAHYCDSRNVGVNVHATLEVLVRGEVIATYPTDAGQRLVPGDLWNGLTLTWDLASESVMVVENATAPTSRPQLCRSN